MGATPLKGLKVFEFTHTVMGPTAGLLFADLGADVVKVEPAPAGDHTRKLTGFAAGHFPAFNRNKRSLALDLKQVEGRAAMYRLLADADVVIENYGPGTMERLGCGYEQIAAINPRIVYLALKGYLAGPYENRPALDEVVQFQSGLAYMTGPPGRPLRAGGSVIDITGAIFGVVAVQAALLERARTGKGQRVGSALFESAVFLMATHMAGNIAIGENALPMPARGSAWAIYDLFDTADGTQLFLGVTSDQQWDRFVVEFGLEALAADPRLAINAMRVKERSWLLPALREVLATVPEAEIAQRCERAKVSCAPVGKPEDLFDHEHLLASGGLLDTFVAHFNGAGGEIAGMPNLPVEFGLPRTRPGLTRQPPRMGEHNAEVLAEAGYTPTEIAAMAARKVIVAA